MLRLRSKTVLLLTAFALPFWVTATRETVQALGQAPLLTLQRDTSSPSLSMLRWQLDLSAEQVDSLEQLTATAAGRLDDLAAEALSARMAATLTAPDAPAAARRQRELALAEVQLLHEQRLLERRLRDQLTPAQVARLEHWEDRARHLNGVVATAAATLAFRN